MWILDVDRVMGISSPSARKLFGVLWTAMDTQTQTVTLDDRMRTLMSRQNLSLALLELQHKGIIRKGKAGLRWGTLWINPAVVRPWWLKGDLYYAALDAYEQGPSNLRT